MHIFTSITKYTIALFFLLSFIGNAQENKKEKKDNTTKKDSTTIKQKYGIRVGGDVSKLALSFIDDNYKGFEISGDIRFTKKWYLAAEIGAEEKITQTDFINNTSSGNYFKVGGDYNMYENWLDMNNLIYLSPRIGFSSFSQTLNSYSVSSKDMYWNTTFTSTTPIVFNGLNALWAEIGLGIKAEIFNNLFVGLQVQLKRILNTKTPENYQNLYIPGFNKTYDKIDPKDGSKFKLNSIGTGFGYTISYLIPVIKKAEKKKKEKNEKPNKE